jgi:hypothetical protein
MTTPRMTDAEIEQWAGVCNHEPAREALRELIALRALATPSTGAVGIITGEGENGTEVSWYEGPELSKGTKLYAAPPSSPSERDAALEVPTGAIVNGRILIERLERDYKFECEAGALVNCVEWQDLVRCFNHLADYASRSNPVGPEAGE